MTVSDRGAGRILVVDDDEDVREAVADLLRDEGFIVDTAENGRVALELLRTRLAALIFLDLEMPEIDGDAFIRIAKDDQRLAAIPIVVITASRTHSLPTGVRIVHKPCSTEALLEIAHAHVGAPVGAKV
jgi:two-component system chemotaxis response regulator CheY